MDQGDKPRAIEYLQNAAEHGRADAAVWLGHIYEQQGRLEDAFQCYKIAGVERGSEEGLCDYARMLLNGQGCERNEISALEMYNMLARNGNQYALLNLSKIWKYGMGWMAKDSDKAFNYCYEAAKKACPEAYHQLAVMILNGEGCQKDAKCSVQWYEKAVEAGLYKSMHNLARLLMDGTEVPKDERRAVELYKKAADGGIPQALFRYGECLALGKGVPKSEDEAMTYIERAAQLGNPAAKSWVESGQHNHQH
jgi:TPR repeat protein